ncbi:class I SAM-dependent methyltransferase [Chitinophaga arvensicola]|uniref:Methyltransferase domain-containing protein n=1 Tax=Chitinophaga arvensicola TaxID=29529 RepID=A0A1I0P9G6_9BACT|nr:class I SAM-dependent methyltransferase [Chitinophaga arvensicola]SEW10854.1 Methyltransferase domain-containing protein [Chitinophaga arvensicola]
MQPIVKKILKKTALPVYLQLRGFYYRGTNVSCPCCEQSFSRFLPIGVDQRPGMCPRCRSNERDRALWLYMQRTPDFIRAGKRLLHIGPEAIFYRYFKELKGLDYVPADKFAPSFERTYPGDTIYLDIVHMPEMADDSFDVILCSHVLEYIKEDRKAISELFRVLKPGGIALIQVPIKPGLKVTHEDDSITSPEQRALVYGDPGHIRYYGEDYARKLIEAGFETIFIPFRKLFSAKDIQEYGLVGTDDFQLVRKRS